MILRNSPYLDRTPRTLAQARADIALRRARYTRLTVADLDRAQVERRADGWYARVDFGAYASAIDAARVALYVQDNIR